MVQQYLIQVVVWMFHALQSSLMGQAPWMYFIFQNTIKIVFRQWPMDVCTGGRGDTETGC